ncbi:ATP-binding protein [Massilia sp. KIM]|uniref:ATP-binding protein n=1 Tax=Massilia sp. KIM TaxID=1955422 RepID=UPI00098F177D|nr:ATP-binding protein [Massilia sp. KIM]
MAERRWRLWPQSLLGRLSLVMVAGLLLTQLAASMIWGMQLRSRSTTDLRVAAQYIGQGVASSIRFFRSLPPAHRGLLIQQFREMGGTRFYVGLNRAAVSVRPIPSEPLTIEALRALDTTLRAELPAGVRFRLDFARPEQLAMTPDGLSLADLPDTWVRHVLMLKPDPAPILVIQTELETGNWLYLATLMPNPYFLKGHDPLAMDRLLPQAMSLLAVLLLSILVVRSITRPLAALSDAAEAFGKEENAPALPESGSYEFVNTARAFGAMRERIARYIADRDRLFISISHDLRTPITRLKLRAELLDDEALRSDFEEDLDELDMMVKGALQCVKDSDIHENPTAIRLDGLLQRMVKSASLAGQVVVYEGCGLTVHGKPLALKRAIGNLLDNALHYGERAYIGVRRQGEWIEIVVRDNGPGVPQDAVASLFEPYVRLDHGRASNDGGLGLGLGIARSIIEAHRGELILANHPEGGLAATIKLHAVPASP